MNEIKYCPACGGEPNTAGDLIHRFGCPVNTYKPDMTLWNIASGNMDAVMPCGHPIRFLMLPGRCLMCSKNGIEDVLVETREKLTNEVERLQAELRQLNGDDLMVESLLRLTPAEKIRHLKKLLGDQREEVKRLRSALENIANQYKDPKNWDVAGDRFYDGPPIETMVSDALNGGAP